MELDAELDRETIIDPPSTYIHVYVMWMDRPYKGMDPSYLESVKVHDCTATCIFRPG